MLVILLWLERKHEVLVTSDPFTLTRNFSYPAVLSSSAPNEGPLHLGARLLTLSTVHGMINRLCLSSPLPQS